MYTINQIQITIFTIDVFTFYYFKCNMLFSITINNITHSSNFFTEGEYAERDYFENLPMS